MATRRKKTAPRDAVALLVADHKEVAKLFAGYKRAKARNDRKAKSGLVVKICQALTLHATIEEEIFYPDVERALGKTGPDKIGEATVEHGSLKMLIAELEAMAADDKLFDPTVKVLQEYVEHHVEEEETDMFPKVRRTKLDLMAIGEQLAARKKELATTGISTRLFQQAKKLLVPLTTPSGVL
jgi:hemerythrin superfamily protein